MSTAKVSLSKRHKKKLLEKANWYNKRRRSKGAIQKEIREQPVPKSILLVEHTKGGELATRLRELMRRLTPIIGFSMKIVERAGNSLRSSFLLASLWDDIKCERADCVPCEQGGEKLQPCYMSSVLFENVCKTCNQEADLSKEQPELRTVYVGESSRSMYERMKEHWGAWRNKKEDSHMFIHHQNEGAEQPTFQVRAVKFYKSALTWQIGEDIILISKCEFDRCKIPRLVLEEEE